MSNPEAIRLVQAIRSDHSVYTTFQHKEALVAILNSFAHTDWSLPSDWEKKIDPKTKKVDAFFIGVLLITTWPEWLCLLSSLDRRRS